LKGMIHSIIYMLKRLPFRMHMLGEKHRKVREEVLRRVKPTPEEDRRIEEVVQELMERIERAKELLQLSWEIRAELVGSIAKGTHLKDPDIDIFLLFPRGVGVETLHTVGLKLCLEVLPQGQKLYTQHPYIHGEFMGFEVDLVPCFEMKKGEEIGSMVDRTPLHTRFVKEHLDESGKDEVRLLKAFLKGIKAYGAEEAVKGMSGYLAELFIIKFSNFEKTLQELSRIRPHTKLTLGGREAAVAVRRKYTDDDPLIFIDPVDPSRNVASALSAENLLYVKKAACCYLRAPSLSFFFPRRISEIDGAKDIVWEKVQAILGSGGGILLLTVDLPPVQADIYTSQTRRFLKRAVETFEREGFRKIKSGFYIYSPPRVGPFPAPRIKEHIESERVELVMLFIFPQYRKGERKLHLGPPVHVKARAEDFRRKWEGREEALSRIFIRDGRLALYIRRRMREPHQMLPVVLKALPSHLKKAYESRITISVNRGIDIERYWEALYLALSGRELWELDEDTG